MQNVTNSVDISPHLPLPNELCAWNYYCPGQYFGPFCASVCGMSPRENSEMKKSKFEYYVNSYSSELNLAFKKKGVKAASDTRTDTYWWGSYYTPVWSMC